MTLPIVERLNLAIEEGAGSLAVECRDTIEELVDVLAAADAALREAGAGYAVRNDIDTVLAKISGHPESCPVCSGDCSAANPPVLNCPMRRGQ